jgi:hypothetical protein
MPQQPPPPPRPPDRSWIEFAVVIRNQDPGVIERMIIERGDYLGTGHMTTSEVYGEFIEAELKAEKDRRDSVHTRAGAAVTSSAGLITLVLGVFGFLVGKGPGFPGSAKPFLVAAGACLLLAGGFAVVAGSPLGQKFVSNSTLSKMLDSHLDDSPEVARDAVAYMNAVCLLSLRRRTTFKTRLLFTSGIWQILAMLAIGGSIWAAAYGW